MLRVVGAATAAAPLSGCIFGTGKQTQVAKLQDNEFVPKNARADTGMPFGWENHDDVTHVVTSASDNWDMETKVDPGKVINHTFSQGGVYDVVCKEHGNPDNFTGMRMKIAVGDAEIKEPVK